MIRYLFDPANAITATGIVFSGLALHFALNGQFEAAVALGLWAMLADQLDGIVAGRTRNRSKEVANFGKSIDGFADLVYGAVLPAVIVVGLSKETPISFVTGIVLLLVGAIRLSYFSNFGLSADRRFLGVPLSYDIPLLAVLLLCRPWLGDDIFPLLTNLIFLSLAALHIASIRIPAPNTIAYGCIVVFALGASAALVTRALA
ncbi:CDP-alcohol phosphatidyltransferase family protein [Rhizobium sp. ZPR3]|uniref:CDP-alcohol phosphatidyltransferase family protein n=2 Tax=unclassified Rhizobium TaxID=2613769 RepID=A0AAU7SR41_9HYPH